ncbi:hypothetical protein PoB_001622400 [Plakobranchus ocellatus]|uniref:Uncharacterized protein n=1 Tax=Plakobranchus ocellatus TaxID=259542 RepID=A0AAV3Z5P6_9GAST|nr:hypothetical protein PoB_001622400 [Plakobranchus ocellatus]
MSLPSRGQMQSSPDNMEKVAELGVRAEYSEQEGRWHLPAQRNRILLRIHLSENRTFYLRVAKRTQHTICFIHGDNNMTGSSHNDPAMALYVFG